MNEIDADVPVATTNSNDEQSDIDSDSSSEIPRKKKKGLSGLLGAFYQEKEMDPHVHFKQYFLYVVSFLTTDYKF